MLWVSDTKEPLNRLRLMYKIKKISRYLLNIWICAERGGSVGLALDLGVRTAGGIPDLSP